jgi:uncharacterized protein (DUF983 family)
MTRIAHDLHALDGDPAMGRGCFHGFRLKRASAMCRHCGAVHLAPGFSRLTAFVCDECGESIGLSDDHEIDSFFPV